MAASQIPTQLRSRCFEGESGAADRKYSNHSCIRNMVVGSLQGSQCFRKGGHGLEQGKSADLYCEKPLTCKESFHDLWGTCSPIAAALLETAKREVWASTDH